MSASAYDDCEVMCARCGGSGCVPSIRRGPFVEDGLVRPDLCMEMCESCMGSGWIPAKKEKPA